MVKVLKEALDGVTPEVLAIINSRAAKSIDEFCLVWGLSRAFYYKLRILGKGPAEMRLNGTVRISNEAEQSWAKARQREGVVAAKEVARRKAAKTKDAA